VKLKVFDSCYFGLVLTGCYTGADNNLLLSDFEANKIKVTLNLLVRFGASKLFNLKIPYKVGLAYFSIGRKA
jgi:hypothetical protein